MVRSVSFDWLVGLPNRFTGSKVKSRNEHLLPRSTMHDDSIAINNWRRTITPHVLELAQLPSPQFLPLEVVAKDSCRTVPGNDAFAVGDRRGSAVGVCIVRHFLLR